MQFIKETKFILTIPAVASGFFFLNIVQCRMPPDHYISCCRSPPQSQKKVFCGIVFSERFLTNANKVSKKYFFALSSIVFVV